MYLCTVCESKLIFDLAFELNLQLDANSLKNFIAT